MARISSTEIDGIRLKNLMLAGSKWLSHHRAYLDKINFFPVPDGDTGSNLYLTLAAVCAKLRNLDRSPRAGDVAKEAAMGALMGSKGNSGIILAQYFRGFSESIGSKKVIHAKDIAEALVKAAETARAGVHNPREGTILSVARDGAKSCSKNVKKNAQIISVLVAYYESAKLSLERTKNSLPELKKAKVVDSGAYGLVLIFEGMLRFATGVPFKTTPKILGVKPARGSGKIKKIRHRFCTSFLMIKKRGVSDSKVLAALKKHGDSVVLDRGINNISKVHLHTNSPDILLEKASELGKLENVNIEDMVEQAAARRRKK